jgi:hypothetical protein
MIVKEIPYQDTKDFILNKHYAGRMPSVSYSFGLFLNDILEGVLTIGKPASHSLCIGVCGQKHSEKVYELNRLVVNDGLPKNTLSKFVSKTLRLLKNENLIIVSYADEGMGHHGYIYQATNWIYTGKTKERTDKYTPKGKHSRHYNNNSNHLRKHRTAKHRYVYFTGKKYDLNYKIEPYPKGDNDRYVLGTKMKTKVTNKLTGETFFE